MRTSYFYIYDFSVCRCKTSQTCINSTLVCDFRSDCDDSSDEAGCGNCDFESGDFCGWQDISSGRYNWTVVPATPPGTYFYLMILTVTY